MTNMRSIVVLVLIASAFAISCQGTVGGVAYDLTPLKNDMADYRTELWSSDNALNRTIIYNICRNTIAVPKDMEGGDKCVETGHKVESGQTITTKEPAPIYLISKAEGGSSTCNRLGLDFTKEENAQISLIDRTDPAIGVLLTYKEGDYCCPIGVSCPDGKYKQKTFTISFRCSDAVDSIPTLTSVDTKNNGCDYTVYYRSIYACPTDCPRVGNNVCGEHGVCGYDRSTKKARCYCGTKYTGPDCQKFQYKSLLSVDALVVVVTILLTVVVICTIFYVWNKLRMINVDPDAFNNLESKFNELGQLAY